jgi:putative phosphonate metabolism protein
MRTSAARFDREDPASGEMRGGATTQWAAITRALAGMVSCVIALSPCVARIGSGKEAAMSYARYAIYFAPQDGPLARFGAAWLGWDLAAAARVAHPPAAGVDVAAVTETPRRYGFHATLKPPMRLAAGRDAAGLSRALGAVCATLAPVRLDGLALSRLGRFLALTPVGDAAALNAAAARLVAGLDDFRAPPDAAELARRRASGLTAAEERNLVRWGYPYVMDAFRFHMTLTDALADPAPVEDALRPMIAALPLSPFVIESVALVGERPDGLFALIERVRLGAAGAPGAAGAATPIST